MSENVVILACACTPGLFGTDRNFGTYFTSNFNKIDQHSIDKLQYISLEPVPNGYLANATYDRPETSGNYTLINYLKSERQILAKFCSRVALESHFWTRTPSELSSAKQVAKREKRLPVCGQMHIQYMIYWLYHRLYHLTKNDLKIIY